MPTLAGFLAFIRNVMGIPTNALPDSSPDVAACYTLALEIVSPDLAALSSVIYPLAVYNLAGDFLINYAQDQPGSTYFETLRTSYKIYNFVAGVITSSSDVSTSESLATPEALKNLTLADLQNLKTPYGRQYLAFAQRLGTMWGIS